MNRTIYHIGTKYKMRGTINEYGLTVKYQMKGLTYLKSHHVIEYEHNFICGLQINSKNQLSLASINDANQAVKR